MLISPRANPAEYKPANNGPQVADKHESRHVVCFSYNMNPLSY